MDKNYGFDIYLWGLNNLAGDDVNANFVPLSLLPDQVGNNRVCYRFRVYGLKPERPVIPTAEGLNNSINNSAIFLQQFTIMVKALKNTDVTQMRFYRAIQALQRMPYKYFSYWEPDYDGAFLPEYISTPPVFREYFDRTDIPENQAMRCEILNENVKHNFTNGTKTVEVQIRSYKPFRQVSVGNIYGVDYL